VNLGFSPGSGRRLKPPLQANAYSTPSRGISPHFVGVSAVSELGTFSKPLPTVAALKRLLTSVLSLVQLSVLSLAIG
jgi:hypothetical protein